MRKTTSRIFEGVFWVTLCATAFPQLVLQNAGGYAPKTEWESRLGYLPAEIFPVRFKVTACPLVEVKIDGRPFWLTFDFGSADGMMVTTAVEGEIKYEFVRNLTTSYADGSPRGSGKEIILKRMETLGRTFENVHSDLFDWKTFSSYPNDGLISLEYIENTRFTLDYPNKRLAVTAKPFPEELGRTEAFTTIALLESPDWNKYGLYLTGNVNGHDVVIYIDSGSSHSFIDRRILEGKSISKMGNNDICLSEIPVAIGGLSLTVSKARVSEIRRNTTYALPVRMVIGSDLLKNFVITVDRTPGRNLLIIHR